MSKRYVIQVNVGSTEDSGLNGQWQNVQHPAGGDWLTRSRSTAIADAANLVNAGETRELRIGVSRPVYAVTPDVGYAQIVEASHVLAAGDWNGDDVIVPVDVDALEQDGAPAAQFEVVDEGPAVTHGDDPTGN